MRIEEQSAYALADAVAPDAKKADALLAFVATHPAACSRTRHLFGSAAALSRIGRLDDALAARCARLERATGVDAGSAGAARLRLRSGGDGRAGGSCCPARAIRVGLPEAAGQGGIGWAAGEGRFPGAAGLRRGPGAKRPPRCRDAPGGARRAAAGAPGSLARAGAVDEAPRIWTSSGSRWPSSGPRVGEPVRAAREMTAIARTAKEKLPSRWPRGVRRRGSTRSAQEIGNAQRCWAELEHVFLAIGPKGREKLPPEAFAAAAEAHFALGASGFDSFRRQQIRPPLMATLNRKISLLQGVKKRTEETVAMRAGGTGGLRPRAARRGADAARSGDRHQPVSAGIERRPAQALSRGAGRARGALQGEARETLKSARGKGA